MQICIICKRDLRGFHGAKCPVDGYPNIDIFGDDKEYIRDHFDEIEKYRRNFMQSVSIDARFHCWEREDGKLTQSQDMQDTFGDLSQLYERVSWLPVCFTGRSKRPELDVTLIIKKKTDTAEKKITVPNPGESDCDMLGIKVDSAYTYRVLVRNQEGKITESAPQMLFE